MMFLIIKKFTKRILGCLSILFFPMVAIMYLLTAESSREWIDDTKGFYHELLIK